jgi:hypothetical protein
VINRAISHEHIFGICRMGGTNCSLPINQSTTDQDCQFPAATGLNGLMAKVNFDGGGFSMDDRLAFSYQRFSQLSWQSLHLLLGSLPHFGQGGTSQLNDRRRKPRASIRSRFKKATSLDMRAS